MSEAQKKTETGQERVFREKWSDGVLDQNIDLYFTVTFRQIVTDYLKAKNRIETCLRFLNSKKSGYLYRRKLKVWMFFEQNNSGPGFHVHGLIKGMPSWNAHKLERIFKDKFGVSEVREFNYDGIRGKHRGFVYYLAKKIGTKELIDFSDCIIKPRYRLAKNKELQSNIKLFRKEDGTWYTML